MFHNVVPWGVQKALPAAQLGEVEQAELAAEAAVVARAGELERARGAPRASSFEKKAVP